LPRVKVCSYCGRQNETGAGACAECGTELPAATTGDVTPDEMEPVADAPLSELAGLDMGFEVVEGFSHPDWKGIAAYIKDRVPKEDWETVWSQVAARWLEELAVNLGGGGRVHRSDNFFCLSDLDSDTTKTLLDYAESVLEVIRGCLKAAAWTGYYGKHVLLFFFDPDDYYAYISHFYPEGTHILSTGVFIRRGYTHIALPFVKILSAQHTLVH
jgi:hypothetical protein